MPFVTGGDAAVFVCIIGSGEATADAAPFGPVKGFVAIGVAAFPAAEDGRDERVPFILSIT